MARRVAAAVAAREGKPYAAIGGEQ